MPKTLTQLDEKINFNNKFISQIKSDFKFGIEIECYLSSIQIDDDNDEYTLHGNSWTSNPQIIYDYLLDELNENFGDIFRDVTYDDSLSNTDNGIGIEIISDIISYDQLETMDEVINFLDIEYGIVFDETCGLHISFSSNKIKDYKKVNWLKVAVLGGTEEMAKSNSRYESIMAASLQTFFRHIKTISSEPGFTKKEKKKANAIYKVIMALYENHKNGIPLTNKNYYIKILEKMFTYILSNSIGTKQDKIGGKWSAINLSDFINRKGRVEVRVLGNKAAEKYPKVIEDINNLLSAVIIGSDKEYDEEYQNQLLDYIVEIVSKFTY